MTIPKQLRDSPGIEPGREPDLVGEDGRPIGHKIRRRTPIDEVYGILPFPGDTDASIDDQRGPVELP